MPLLDRLSGGLLHARAAQALAARDAALYGGDVYRPAEPPTLNQPTTCGAVGCTSGWLKPWKNRRRPMFEGEWACGTRCLESMVRSSLRREIGDGAAADAAEPHRHRVPLGLVLLAQGWITQAELQRALEAQRATGRGRIGDWLTESCGVSAEHVTRGLGVQWSCPVLPTDGFSPSAMALVMPKRFVAEFGVLPLRVAGSSMLYMAFANRMDAAASLAVEQMTGLKVQSGLLGETQFDSARAALLAAPAVPVTMALAADADALHNGIVRALEQRQPLASRLVRVHGYYWLRMWLESGALSGVGDLPAGTEDVEDRLFLIGKGSIPPMLPGE